MLRTGHATPKSLPNYENLLHDERRNQQEGILEFKRKLIRSKEEKDVFGDDQSQSEARALFKASKVCKDGNVTRSFRYFLLVYIPSQIRPSPSISLSAQIRHSPTSVHANSVCKLQLTVRQPKVIYIVTNKMLFLFSFILLV